MKRVIKTFLFILLFLIQLSPYLSDCKAATNETNKTSQNYNPVVFIHGWTKDSSDFDKFIDWFITDGWPAEILIANNFEVRDNCSVQTNINNANMIKQWVDDILNETGAEKVDLVGHSMGGLSSRYYIKFLDGIDKVDDYVSLGSPQHGENIATCGAEGVNALALLLNEGDETPGGILNDTIGNRIDPVSGVIYNSTHIPGNIYYTSIFSRADAIPYISPPLDGANNTEVEGLTHSQLYQAESAYKAVKAAVEGTFPNRIPTTTTQTTSKASTTTQTAALEILPFLIIIVFTMWIKRKN